MSSNGRTELLLCPAEIRFMIYDSLHVHEPQELDLSGERWNDLLLDDNEKSLLRTCHQTAEDVLDSAYRWCSMRVEAVRPRDVLARAVAINWDGIKRMRKVEFVLCVHPLGILDFAPDAIRHVAEALRWKGEKLNRVVVSVRAMGNVDSGDPSVVSSLLEQFHAQMDALEAIQGPDEDEKHADFSMGSLLLDPTLQPLFRSKLEDRLEKLNALHAAPDALRARQANAREEISGSTQTSLVNSYTRSRL